MLKGVLGVIVGYLAMAIVVFATLSGAYLTLGADRAFAPGTYEVSTLWLATSFTLSLIAAMVGGWVCSRIAGPGAVKALAGLVLVLGIILVIPALDPASDTRPTVRAADTPNLEAMTNARQPTWVSLTIPVLGAIGVLIGGSRKRS